MSKDISEFTPEIIELRDRIIAEGLQSVATHETRDYRKQGCIEGLNLCRKFNTLANFEAVVTVRHADETRMRMEKTEPEIFWTFRCATAQIEFVYERMKVACNSGGMGQYHSARAVLHVADLTGPQNARPF